MLKSFFFHLLIFALLIVPDRAESQKYTNEYHDYLTVFIYEENKGKNDHEIIALLEKKLDSLTENRIDEFKPYYFVVNYLNAYYSYYLDTFFDKYLEVNLLINKLGEQMLSKPDPKLLELKIFETGIYWMEYSRGRKNKDYDLINHKIIILLELIEEANKNRVENAQNLNYAYQLILTYYNSISDFENSRKYFKLYSSIFKEFDIAKNETYYIIWQATFSNDPNSSFTELKNNYLKVLQSYQAYNPKYSGDIYYYSILESILRLYHNYHISDLGLGSEIMNGYLNMGKRYSKEYFKFIVELLSPYLRSIGYLGMAMETTYGLYYDIIEKKYIPSELDYVALCNELARCFHVLKNKENEIFFLTEGNRFVSYIKINFQNYLTVRLLYYNLFEYYSSSNSDSAIHYIEKAIYLEEYILKKYGTHKPFLYNTLGFFQFKLKKYSDAEQNFKKHIFYHTEADSINLITQSNAISNFHLGQIKYIKGYTDEGLNLMMKSIEKIRMDDKYSPSEFGAGYELMLTPALEENKMYDLANKYYLNYFKSIERTLTNGLLFLGEREQVDLINAYRKVNETVLNALKNRDVEKFIQIPMELGDFLSYKNKILEINRKLNIINNYMINKDSNYVNIRKLYIENKSFRKALIWHRLTNQFEYDSTNSLIQEQFRYLRNFALNDSNNILDITSLSDVVRNMSNNDCLISINSFLSYDIESAQESMNYCFLVANSRDTSNAFLYFSNNGKKMEDIALSFFNSKTEARGKKYYGISKKEASPDVGNFLPMFEEIQVFKNWKIINDGVFHLINPSVLKIDNKRFVIDNHSITVYSTLEEILTSNKVPLNPSALIIGAPKFKLSKNADYVKLKMMNDDCNPFLNELPGAKKEIEQINTILTHAGYKTDYFFGADANKLNLENSKNKNIIHIATHGFFENKSNVFMENSGFFLAGAQDFLKITCDTTLVKEKSFYLNSGVVTGSDLQDLDLTKVWLFCISACETGIGNQIQGEGVWGLPTALKLAGVKNIIYTLSPIDDDVTTEFMVKFYSDLTITSDLEKSFRSAQIFIKDKYIKPSYWGSFVLFK